jgi:hypothetical protein
VLLGGGLHIAALEPLLGDFQLVLSGKHQVVALDVGLLFGSEDVSIGLG